MTDPDEQRRARASQSFWTMVVGVPVVFSVLRLGVEAGGELQTTLLLVSNVDPTNLLASIFTTASRYVSGGLVAVFSMGGVLLASRTRPLTEDRPYLFVRWTEAAPTWFVVASFLLALITWPVLYLPMLVPCAVAAAQATAGLLPLGINPPVLRRLVLLGLLLAYLWLVGPAVSDAAQQREWLVAALFIGPPLLTFGIRGPLVRSATSPIALSAQTVILLGMLVTAVPVLTTPILPLTVTTVSRQPVAAAQPPTEDILGHVIYVDDVSMAILQERGGVRYVPVGKVEAQVLCPTEDELPRYRIWVHGFHVEDSLLEGLGRHVRPVTRLDAACRNPDRDVYR